MQSNEQIYSLVTHIAIYEQTKEFVKHLGLCANATIASDPFVIPKMQKYKKLQILEESKYEMHLFCGESEELSVASFNLHGTVFTKAFNIKVESLEETVTGCIGYGLERWVLAFLRQYSENADRWPEFLKKSYYEEMS